MTTSIWVLCDEYQTRRPITFLFGPGGICMFRPVCGIDGAFKYCVLTNAAGEEWKVEDNLNHLDLNREAG
jgi:hypothetical protein